jgi:hypothetical protein
MENRFKQKKEKRAKKAKLQVLVLFAPLFVFFA